VHVSLYAQSYFLQKQGFKLVHLQEQFVLPRVQTIWSFLDLQFVHVLGIQILFHTFLGLVVWKTPTVKHYALLFMIILKQMFFQ